MRVRPEDWLSGSPLWKYNKHTYRGLFGSFCSVFFDLAELLLLLSSYLPSRAECAENDRNISTFFGLFRLRVRQFRVAMQENGKEPERSTQNTKYVFETQMNAVRGQRAKKANPNLTGWKNQIVICICETWPGHFVCVRARVCVCVQAGILFVSAFKSVD